MPGSGKLILTGQLGDVMKESAQAALSLVKARAAAARHRRRELLEKSDIHVHVPAGATPKDGPSAGVAMFVALASLLTGRAGAQRRRDDRRDQPARPGAADRRRQGEGAGGAARRHHDGDAAGAQPARPRGHSRRRARAARRSSGWSSVDDAIATALSALANSVHDRLSTEEANDPADSCHTCSNVHWRGALSGRDRSRFPATDEQTTRDFAAWRARAVASGGCPAWQRSAWRCAYH